MNIPELLKKIKVPAFVRGVFTRSVMVKAKNKAVWVLLIALVLVVPIGFLVPEVFLLAEIILRELLDMVRAAQSGAGI